MLAVVIIFVLLAVPRTVVLGVLTYVVPLNVNLCEINATRLNSSNSTEIQTDCAEIPAELNNRSRYFQVTDLLYVIYSVLTLPEYVALAYGLYKLLGKMPNHKTKLCEKSDYQCSKFCFGTILAFIFIIIFTLASLAIPIVGIIHAYIDSRCYPDSKEQILTFHLIYHSLTFLAHVVIPTVRTAMAITVLEVRAIWFHRDVAVPDRTDDIADSTLTENEKEEISKHYNRITEYKQRVSKIKPFLRVFQTWFVFQWFHYFFQAVTDLTRTLHPWITGTPHPELMIAY